MKNILLFTVLILSAAFFNGCSIVNTVRQRYAPPKSSETPKPDESKQAMKIDTETLRTKAKEIADASFPSKLNPKAKAKGKFLIIYKEKTSHVGINGFDFDGKDYDKYDLDKFGLKKEDLALKPDEIKTAFLRTCDKGKEIGQFSISADKKIPAFALDCKVSVIDLQTSAIIAEKKFPSDKMDEYIMTTNSAREWIAPEPSSEMEKYIKNFPRE